MIGQTRFVIMKILIVANSDEKDYFKDPVDMGDKISASWQSQDLHLLKK